MLKVLSLVHSHWGYPMHDRKSVMEIDDKILLKHKLDYLKMTLKISKLCYHMEEPSIDLLLQAQQVGSLAKIPNEELNNLLFNLDI
jgi:hypothetical protein